MLLAPYRVLEVEGVGGGRNEGMGIGGVSGGRGGRGPRATARLMAGPPSLAGAPQRQ